MKLATLIIAGAGLLQINATPLSVTLVSDGGANNETTVAQIRPKVFAKLPPPPPFGVKHHGPHNETHGCAGGASARFRQKAIEISNALRKSFGMPLIQTDIVHVHPHGADHHRHNEHGLGPHGGSGVHDDEEQVEDNNEDNEDEEHRELRVVLYRPPERSTDDSDEWILVPRPPLHHFNEHHHHDMVDDDEEPPFPPPPPPFHSHHLHGLAKHHPPGPHHFRHHPPSFAQRTNFAIHVLGPWTSRAVVFILGCGLSGLFRMLFILVAMSYRTIKRSRSTNSDSEDYEYPFATAPAPVPTFVPAPIYVFDEKNVPLRN